MKKLLIFILVCSITPAFSQEHEDIDYSQYVDFINSDFNWKPQIAILVDHSSYEFGNCDQIFRTIAIAKTPSDLNLITRKSKYRDIWNNMFLIIGDKIKEKFDTYLKNQYSNTEYLGACLVDFQIFSFYQVVIKDSQTTEFKAIQDIDITTTHPFESKFDTKFMLPMIAKEQQSSIELAGAYSYQERKQKVKTYCKHYYRLLTLEKIIKECKRQLDIK